MNVFRESVQEFRHRKWTFRVWREARTGYTILPLHDEDVSGMIAALCKDKPEGIEDLARAILDMERVTAVECKDRAGNGCVLYRAEVIETNDGGLVTVI